MADIDTFKGGFFDRAIVKEKLRGVAFGAILSTASYTRTVSRNSMKKGKMKGGKRLSSPPGKPPYRWKGLIREHTYFAFDTKTDSVVVGPALLGRSRVLPALEYGDASMNIQARPAITPAFEKAKVRLGERIRRAAERKALKGKV